MSPAEILARLTPVAFRLALEALTAILKGDHAKAARKAEEAARRQSVKLAADAALAAKESKKQ